MYGLLRASRSLRGCAVLGLESGVACEGGKPLRAQRNPSHKTNATFDIWRGCNRGISDVAHPPVFSLYYILHVLTFCPSPFLHEKRENARQDVVSDGDIQEKVLGAAQRSEDGFFTAPRVIEK